jgi:hypothetical protein
MLKSSHPVPATGQNRLALLVFALSWSGLVVPVAAAGALLRVGLLAAVAAEEVLHA